MLRARLFDFSLFIIALAIAISFGHILIDYHLYLKALVIYLIFSSLYSHLRISNKYANAMFDTGINYSLSFAIFAGPLGLFFFETLSAFLIYLNKKRTKTADPGEFLDTFYNIGSFVLSYSVSYYLFNLIYPSIQTSTLGFWVLIFLMVCVGSILTATCLMIVFSIMGEAKSFKEALNFVFRSRGILDLAILAITNGLLLLLLQEQKWDRLIGLFILNYVVSLSFYSKSQSIQNKMERDKFEQMAYKDFLTGVFNRAYMDKKMNELNQSSEWVGIVVSDIDKFKKINDNFNHAIGDQVIQHFATSIQSFLDQDDILVRSGGEEFTIMLRNRTFEETVKLVETIKQFIENSQVHVQYNEEPTTVSYTASFGMHYFKTNEDITMEKGYILADQLLIHSKQLGKNKVSYKKELFKEKVKI